MIENFHHEDEGFPPDTVCRPSVPRMTLNEDFFGGPSHPSNLGQWSRYFVLETDGDIAKRPDNDTTEARTAAAKFALLAGKIYILFQKKKQDDWQAALGFWLQTDFFDAISMR